MSNRSSHRRKKVSSGRFFLTWERVAVAAVAISLSLFGIVGRGIKEQVEVMNGAISGLNDTMRDLKMELAVNKATVNRDMDSAFKRLDEIRVSVEKISDRVGGLEKKRGG